MINETNINCFLNVARYKNFSRAAKEMYMTQQSVSQQIAKLEKELGLTLFIRDKHSVVMTIAGHRMYDFFLKFKQDFNEVLEQTRNEVQARMYHIYSGFQNWIDFGPTPALALSALRLDNPEIELSIERLGPGALRESLDSQRIDLIVMYNRFLNNTGNFEVVELFRTPITLFVSPLNPLVRPGATYKDFANEPYIFDTYENNGDEPISEISQKAKQEAEMCGLSPRELIPVSTRDSAYTAAEMGKGIVISTRLSRISLSSSLKMYTTEVDESIICAYRKDNNNPLIEKYARQLEKIYKERTPQRDAFLDKLNPIE